MFTALKAAQNSRQFVSDMNYLKRNNWGNKSQIARKTALITKKCIFSNILKYRFPMRKAETPITFHKSVTFTDARCTCKYTVV
jgi:hypothetical protein